uniref:FYVE-type domain-containing protein n=1 Tax=Globisporangium ultimum (strain ATCC 200006 / CBS 805.95 / DAOM BR144) TaxID=431595 RepID=K3X123_GLOUD
MPPTPPQQITLNRAEQDEYDKLASQLLDKTLVQYSQFNGLIDTGEWSLVRKRKQISIYRSVLDSDDPNVTIMAGSGLIHGSLEDVMDGLYCDTTADLRTVKTLLHYKLVNGSVLNVSERRSAAEPFQFAGIKWVAAKASWGLTKHRDLLTYERMGRTLDKNGNELAFYALYSIDRPECPPDSVKGIKRSKISTCNVFKRLPDNRVEVFAWGEFPDIGSMSHRVAEYVIAGTWLRIVYSVDCAEAKKCSKLMARSAGRSVAATKACHVCRKSTSKFKTRLRCAGCSQTMCKTCSCDRVIFEINMRTGKPMEKRFCKLCINKVAAAPVIQPISQHPFYTEPARGNERVEEPRPKSKSLSATGYPWIEPSGNEASIEKVALAVDEEEDWTTSKLCNFDLRIDTQAICENEIERKHPAASNQMVVRDPPLSKSIRQSHIESRTFQ